MSIRSAWFCLEAGVKNIRKQWHMVIVAIYRVWLTSNPESVKEGLVNKVRIIQYTTCTLEGHS